MFWQVHQNNDQLSWGRGYNNKQLNNVHVSSVHFCWSALSKLWTTGLLYFNQIRIVQPGSVFKLATIQTTNLIIIKPYQLDKDGVSCVITLHYPACRHASLSYCRFFPATTFFCCSLFFFGFLDLCVRVLEVHVSSWAPGYFYLRFWDNQIFN